MHIHTYMQNTHTGQVYQHNKNLETGIVRKRIQEIDDL